MHRCYRYVGTAISDWHAYSRTKVSFKRQRKRAPPYIRLVFVGRPIRSYDEVLKIERVRGVATALLDTAIQSGLDLGAEGTMLLHADPTAGPKLIKFYSGRCGMTQLSQSDPPISTLRRLNPEQYFVMDAATAMSFCAKYDLRR